jgi:hypothetical protein
MINKARWYRTYRAVEARLLKEGCDPVQSAKLAGAMLGPDGYTINREVTKHDNPAGNKSGQAADRHDTNAGRN